MGLAMRILCNNHVYRHHFIPVYMMWVFSKFWLEWQDARNWICCQMLTIWFSMIVKTTQNREITNIQKNKNVITKQQPNVTKSEIANTQSKLYKNVQRKHQESRQKDQ